MGSVEESEPHYGKREQMACLEISTYPEENPYRVIDAEY